MGVSSGSKGSGTYDPTPRNGGIAKHPRRQGDSIGGGGGTMNSKTPKVPPVLHKDIDKSGTSNESGSVPSTRPRGSAVREQQG